LERFLLCKVQPVATRDDGLEMKIYMLLMLIAVIVGFSHLPIRVRTKQAASVPADSV